MINEPLNASDSTISKQKRHPVNMNSEVFERLGMYIAKWGNTKEGIVNQAVNDYVYERDQFLKRYAPHLTLEHSTQNAIFIQDRELDEIVVVRAKWNNQSDKSQVKNPSTFNLICQTCNSDSCIHVRYSLVLPDMLRIKKEDKLV